MTNETNWNTDLFLFSLSNSYESKGKVDKFKIVWAILFTRLLKKKNKEEEEEEREEKEEEQKQQRGGGGEEECEEEKERKPLIAD